MCIRDRYQRRVHGLIDFGMTIDEAVSMPKFVGYSSYKDIRIEEGMPQATIDVLEAMGHKVVPYAYPDLYFGGPNIIAVEDSGMMIGVGSVRRDGAASAPTKQLLVFGRGNLGITPAVLNLITKKDVCL
eukprot:TRINITY_DN12103_c0_g1_i1.p1 TRINITY_DN12103_c0_g1~~TRINITY_DN12103_c0_g1_i1.p1  ORF type:complete len:145 (+),score=27.99 TRINITY_DN12103_c0_g1_i1:50-436(+)